jgi:hypothetical protein
LASRVIQVKLDDLNLNAQNTLRVQSIRHNEWHKHAEHDGLEVGVMRSLIRRSRAAVNACSAFHGCFPIGV